MPVTTSRIGWAKLMARVFEVDVMECPRCRSQMQQIAFITIPDVIQKILSRVGRPGDSPAIESSAVHARPH